ncbi:MAG: hypothetical protein WAK91_09035 [Candidatus Acidiferrales bacterium]|jgi:hypothetical protein
MNAITMKKSREIILCVWAITGCALPLAAQVQPHVTPPGHDITPPAAAPQSTAPPQSDTKQPQAPAATPESLEKGKAIVLAAAKAAGGDALNDVKSIDVASSGQADTPGGTMDISLKLVIIYPNLLHSEAHLPIADISQGFDGSAGWVVSPQGTLDLPAEYAGEFDRGIALAGAWGLYKQALAGKIELQYLGDEDLDGKKVPAVQWHAMNGPVKLFFDPATHLLIGAHFQSITPQGIVETDQRWSDFHAVAGLQYPNHNVIFRDGSKFSDTTVQSVKVNTNPDRAIFSKPATPPASAN